MSSKGRASRDANEHMRDLWRTAEALTADNPGRGEYVPWEAVEVRDDLLPRERIDEDAVNRYAELLDDLPPIEVQRDTLVLIDGRHRLRAASTTRDHVRVVEVDVPDGELFVRAVQANVSHGLPLRQAERVVAAKKLLRLKPKWADAKIAEVCGVSRQAVWGWRQEAARRKERVSQTDHVSRVNVANREVRERRNGTPYTVPERRAAPKPKPRRSPRPDFSWVDALGEALGQAAGERAEAVPDEYLEEALANARELQQQARRFQKWADEYAAELAARMAASVSGQRGEEAAV